MPGTLDGDHDDEDEINSYDMLPELTAT